MGEAEGDAGACLIMFIHTEAGYVNFDRIQRIEPWEGGSRFTMIDGTTAWCHLVPDEIAAEYNPLSGSALKKALKQIIDALEALKPGQHV
jgi:hypothetical protein